MKRRQNQTGELVDECQQPIYNAVKYPLVFVVQLFHCSSSVVNQRWRTILRLSKATFIGSVGVSMNNFTGMNPLATPASMMMTSVETSTKASRGIRVWLPRGILVAIILGG